MNNLEEAGKVIENGFCTSQLTNGDGKFCSVGAIAFTKGYTVEQMREAEATVGVGNIQDHANGWPEVKALAEEIMEQVGADYPYREDLEDAFADGDYAEVIFSWNDEQEQGEPVVEMFKYAAKRL